MRRAARARRRPRRRSPASRRRRPSRARRRRRRRRRVRAPRGHRRAQLDRLDPAGASLLGELEALRLPATGAGVEEQHRLSRRRSLGRSTCTVRAALAAASDTRRPARINRSASGAPPTTIRATAPTSARPATPAYYARRSPPERAVPGGRAGNQHAGQQAQATRELAHGDRDGGDERTPLPRPEPPLPPVAASWESPFAWPVQWARAGSTPPAPSFRPGRLATSPRWHEPHERRSTSSPASDAMTVWRDERPWQGCPHPGLDGMPAPRSCPRGPRPVAGHLIRSGR